MKKMNNKGFTLAELLIVIAIIAILIAIAIPAFGGALENAKRQTDHANMRSAYAMYQTANISGTLYLTDTTTATTGNYVFQKDGTLASSGTNDYQLLANHATTNDDCKASILCTKFAPLTKGATIKISDASGKWEITVS